jgi:hypothetical protein
MVFVENAARVGQVLGAALDERWGHVDARRGDLLCRAATALQFCGDLGDGVGTAILSNGQHTPLGRVGGESDENEMPKCCKPCCQRLQ